MSALDRLAGLLGEGSRIAGKPMPQVPTIDGVLADMNARTRVRMNSPISADQQLAAVKSFWDRQTIGSFRETYLLSWGLCIPHRPEGLCILENGARLEKVLAGADEWSERPAAYRRCYQGLMKSYFSYRPTSDEGRSALRQTWPMLRDYLFKRASRLDTDRACPDWVQTAIQNKQLFTGDPCAPYVDTLLKGDSAIINQLCERLSINQASWFLDKLILAQVEKATGLSDRGFLPLLPHLLTVLAQNQVLRDRGLRRLLDRYAQVPGMTLHNGLRDLSVSSWGNPWLPSNDTRWGGVTPAARVMVADWLKLEFIEDFFTKLAEDGFADPRRMDFWKRYVKAIDHIEFALGASARNSREADFVALRKKMHGLICELDAPGTNNAFIMRMGSLVAVEFSDPGNALYGYDAVGGVPFDTTKLLRLPLEVRNSLKQKSKAVLWQGHHGDARSWNRWEVVLEDKLRQNFGISPGQPSSAPRTHVFGQPAGASEARIQPPSVYSRKALAQFASERGLEVRDKSQIGGNLLVVTGREDDEVSRVLTTWGFTHKPGKGWWK